MGQAVGCLVQDDQCFLADFMVDHDHCISNGQHAQVHKAEGICWPASCHTNICVDRLHFHIGKSMRHVKPLSVPQPRTECLARIALRLIAHVISA